MRADGTTYVGQAITEKYQDLYLNADANIVVKFDRGNMSDRSGQPSRLEPRGMSGGPLFRFDSLLRTGRDDVLAGILIENPQPHSVVVATRISVFMDAIREHYPAP